MKLSTTAAWRKICLLFSLLARPQVLKFSFLGLPSLDSSLDFLPWFPYFILFLGISGGASVIGLMFSMADVSFHFASRKYLWPLHYGFPLSFSRQQKGGSNLEGSCSLSFGACKQLGATEWNLQRKERLASRLLPYDTLHRIWHQPSYSFSYSFIGTAFDKSHFP